MVKLVFSVLGMDDYRVRVSLRDPESDKYVGDPESWDKAEAALREAVKTLGVDYEEELGEAAFYRPRLISWSRASLDREWQLGTVQVDYNLPERFDISSRRFRQPRPQARHDPSWRLLDPWNAFAVF